MSDKVTRTNRYTYLTSAARECQKMEHIGWNVKAFVHEPGEHSTTVVVYEISKDKLDYLVRECENISNYAHLNFKRGVEMVDTKMSYEVSIMLMREYMLDVTWDRDTGIGEVRKHTRWT